MIARLLTIVLALGLLAPDGSAQFVNDGHNAGLAFMVIDGVPALAHSDIDIRRGAEPDLGRIVLGTTAGAALGFVVGTGVSYLVMELSGGAGDGAMFVPLALMLGSAPFVAAGSFAGARWGSGGAGNPWLTAGAAVAGVGLGVLTGVVIGDALSGQQAGGIGPEIIGSMVGITIGIGLPAIVEWSTGR